MNELFLTALILGHIIGDAMLQSRKMGETKSSNPVVLLQHIGILSVFVFWISFLFLPLHIAAAFTCLNAVAHAVIDGSIWNLYKFKVRISAASEYNAIFTSRTKRPFDDYLKNVFIPKFKYWKDKDFYTFIIIDQMLHVLCFIWLLRLVS